MNSKDWLLPAILVGIFIFAVGSKRLGFDLAAKRDLFIPQLTINSAAAETTPSPAGSPAPTAWANTPLGVTSAFYKWYTQCVVQHFSQPIAKSKDEDCSYKESPFVSSSLEIPADLSAGKDPIFCAQSLPRQIFITKVDQNKTRATAAIQAIFDMGKQEIQATLDQTDDVWKISKIKCS